MIYNNIVKAVFKNRPNRFIAECSIDNKNILIFLNCILFFKIPNNKKTNNSKN